MKKILFITTGGTIACKDSGNGLSPQKSGKDLLDTLDLPCDYEILDLYSIDSTDLRPRHLRQLHEAVTRELPHYDGVVILHGTDTIAYTGAFLSMTLGRCKPVILTGSMRAFDEPYSDAPDNIAAAALSACRGDELCGVWLIFGGHIINGADIQKVSSVDTDAFRPYSGREVFETYGVPDSDSFPAVIKLTPFTSPSVFDAVEGNAGLVIETYGAGGLPDDEGLLAAIKRLAERTTVIITTPCRGSTDLSRYEAGRRALGIGCLDSGGMSTECAAVRLWLKSCNLSSI